MIKKNDLYIYLVTSQEYLKDLIKGNGTYVADKNRRGAHNYISMVWYENNNLVRKKSKTQLYQKLINELNDFILQVPYEKRSNFDWWLQEEEAYNGYLKLFKDYKDVVRKLARRSRNTVLTNASSCLTTIFFYFEQLKQDIYPTLNILLTQRSCDIDLGLDNDHLIMHILLDKTYDILQKNKIKCIKGKVKHLIINAHSYCNNMIDWADKPKKHNKSVHKVVNPEIVFDF